MHLHWWQKLSYLAQSTLENLFFLNVLFINLWWIGRGLCWWIINWGGKKERGVFRLLLTNWLVNPYRGQRPAMLYSYFVQFLEHYDETNWWFIALPLIYMSRIQVVSLWRPGTTPGLGNNWYNKTVTTLILPYLSIFSSRFWQRRHNKASNPISYCVSTKSCLGLKKKIQLKICD